MAAHPQTAAARALDLVVGHAGFVSCVAWSPGGSRLATGSSDGTVKVWDSFNLTTALDMGDDHTGRVSSVAWSPDGLRLASASWDGTVKVWDSFNLTTALDTGDDHTDAVFSVAWSADGSRLASASRDGSVKSWESANLTSALGTGNHTDMVLAVAWEPNGTRFATGSTDATVRVWESANLTTALATGKGHTGAIVSVAWSSDGYRLASGSVDNNQLGRVHGDRARAVDPELWDAGRRNSTSDSWRQHSRRWQSWPWQTHGDGGALGMWKSSDLSSTLDTSDDQESVISVAWTPDNKRLATASLGGALKVWNSSDLSSEVLACALQVLAVAWSPDGTRLATGSKNGVLAIWDATCQPLSPAAHLAEGGGGLSTAAWSDAAVSVVVLLLVGCGVLVRTLLTWRRRAKALVARLVEMALLLRSGPAPPGSPKGGRRLRAEMVRLELEMSRHAAELSCEQKAALERQLGAELSASLLRSRIAMSQLQLGPLLGEGMYGAVSRGTYQQTPCAVKPRVKQLKRHRLTEEGLAAFKREVELQLDLRHPNIIALIGSCWNVEEGFVCSVLELGANGTLGALLGDPLSKLDWEHERLPIALGVARGVAYLHSVHIIHRDLKPENVLLGDAMVPKVADFGTSREGDDSLTMTAVGTLLFAAPELLMHSRCMPMYGSNPRHVDCLAESASLTFENHVGADDETVDVWSFGCVCACLHHWRPTMVTGGMVAAQSPYAVQQPVETLYSPRRPTPYPGEPSASLVARIIAGEIQPAEAIPEGDHRRLQQWSPGVRPAWPAAREASAPASPGQPT